MTELNEILDRLPEYMEKNGTGNEYVLAPVVDELDDVDTDVDDVDLETNPKTATNIPSLAKLGALVDEKPGGSNFDQYRRDVLLRYAQNTSSSTTADILSALATLIGVDVEQVKIKKDLTEPTTSVFSIPIQETEEADISIEGLSRSMTEFCSAGYQVNIFLRGSFTYTDSEQYQDGSMDPEKGYDGLDENGEPTNENGTYSGII